MAHFFFFFFFRLWPWDVKCSLRSIAHYFLHCIVYCAVNSVQCAHYRLFNLFFLILSHDQNAFDEAKKKKRNGIQWSRMKKRESCESIIFFVFYRVPCYHLFILANAKQKKKESVSTSIQKNIFFLFFFLCYRCCATNKQNTE